LCVSPAATESDMGKPESIPKQLLNEVDMGHNHATAAVALASELVHRVTVKTSLRRETSQGDEERTLQ
jgi:hypothetical protein